MVDVQLQTQHKVRLKAMDLLARREHSFKELIIKLTHKGFEQEVIEQTLNRLRDQGLQSDERFVEAFVNVRIKKGQGPVRILKELQERGVSSMLQEEYIDIRDQHWRTLISQVRIKKFGPTLPEEYKKRAQQARYLQYRGFTTEQIRREIKDND